MGVLKGTVSSVKSDGLPMFTTGQALASSFWLMTTHHPRPPVAAKKTKKARKSEDVQAYNFGGVG
jgi:hypothetical protein